MLDMGWTPSSMQDSDMRGQFEAAIRRFNLGHRLTEAQPSGQEAAADLDVGAAEQASWQSLLSLPPGEARRQQLLGSSTPSGPAAPTTPAEEEVAPRGGSADVGTPRGRNDPLRNREGVIRLGRREHGDGRAAADQLIVPGLRPLPKEP